MVRLFFIAGDCYGRRELAAIKVLGFYDREVHLYVNKETMILTGVGILCGIPPGYAKRLDKSA